MSWYVLYTKPKNERKTSSLLDLRGIQVYCPTQLVVRQWSDRKKKIEEPIFRSYVFVNMTDYARECSQVLETSGAVRFLWLNGKPGIVRDWEIEAIRLFLGEYANIESRSIQQLLPGDEVVINGGALNAQKGYVVRVRGNRASLRLHSLGIELTADVPVSALSLVESLN